MPTPNDTDARLSAMEVKLAFAEDTLDQLNATIYRQQQVIDSLARELLALRDRLPAEGATEFLSLRDELPPHY